MTTPHHFTYISHDEKEQISILHKAVDIVEKDLEKGKIFITLYSVFSNVSHVLEIIFLICVYTQPRHLIFGTVKNIQKTKNHIKNVTKIWKHTVTQFRNNTGTNTTENRACDQFIIVYRNRVRKKTIVFHCCF